MNFLLSSVIDVPLQCSGLWAERFADSSAKAQNNHKTCLGLLHFLDRSSRKKTVSTLSPKGFGVMPPHVLPVMKAKDQIEGIKDFLRT